MMQSRRRAPDGSYADPDEDPDREYAKEHRLLALADTITQKLVTLQPEDPIEAIHTILRDSKSSGVSAPPGAPALEDLESARAYLERYSISNTLDSWIRRVLMDKPADHIDYSLAYFDRLAGGGLSAPTRSSAGPAANRNSQRSDSIASSDVSVAQPPRPSARNPRPRVLIVYYSAYGHVADLVRAAADGAREFDGATVEVRRVKETLPPEQVARQSITIDTAIPEATVPDLQAADAIIFGFGARFGTAPAQLAALIDTTSPLWTRGALVGKPGAMLISTGTQHGGHEMAARHFSSVMLHHGMVLVGVPPTELGRRASSSGVQGGSYYAAGTVAGQMGDRRPSDEEKRIAHRLGLRVAKIASKITLPLR